MCHHYYLLLLSACELDQTNALFNFNNEVLDHYFIILNYETQ
jgi:hypothetical protein